MSLTNAATLSLSLGRNRLGFAVFRHGHMEYYGGKTLNRYPTALDRNRGIVVTLDRLVKDHNISKIALLKLNKQQSHSSELRSLYAAVRRFCVKNGLAVEKQDPVLTRRKLTGDADPTKENVRTRLIARFPELKRYSSGGGEWERRYYGHVFTAIGAGMVASGFATTSGERVVE